MKAVIHRGTKEIGGSCLELREGDSRIVLDLGMPLVKPGVTPAEPYDHRAFKNVPGPELVRMKVLPEIRGLYAWDMSSPPAAGLFISHAHQDHYGFIRYVRPDVPVHMSTGTMELLKASAIFLPDAPAEVKNPVIIKDRKPVTVGPFTVTPHLVDHSAPDAMALTVEAGGKRLFYTGDFRAHGRKGFLFDRMIANPPRNIDRLLIEGTMMGRAGAQEFPDERAVEAALVREFAGQTNVSLVFGSSQNLDRFCTLYRAALQTGKTLVIDLYTAFILLRLRILSDKIPQFWNRPIRVLHGKSHAKTLVRHQNGGMVRKAKRYEIDLQEIAARGKEMVVFTRANYLLGDFATALGEHAAGTKLIWSMWDGYLKDNQYVADLSKRTGSPVLKIHTSGHATVGDLRTLIAAIAPKAVTPIHTFDADKFPAIADRVITEDDGREFEV